MFKYLNEDCFIFLTQIPSKSIDLILIDPPYEISRSTNFQSGEETGRDTDRFRISMDFGEWDKNFSGLENVIKEGYRILKDGGTFICFYDLWKITPLKEMFEKNKYKQIRYIEWLKTNPVPINSKINYLTNSREIAISAIKVSKPTFNSSYDNGLYQYPICQDKGRFHPTQKPLAFMEELIKKHSSLKNDYAELNDKYEKINISRKNIAEKSRMQDEKIDVLTSTIHKLESNLARLESKNRVLEDQAFEQERIINTQRHELETIRPQLAEAKDLVKLVEDAKAVLADDKDNNNSDNYGYYRRAA